jgi:hypothetical protein
LQSWIAARRPMRRKKYRQATDDIQWDSRPLLPALKK